MDGERSLFQPQGVGKKGSAQTKGTAMHMRLLAFVFLILSGCQSEEDRMLAEMSAPERASYDAIARYYKCLDPLIEAAKSRPELSDQEIEKLGYGCPTELEDVALKLVARPDYMADVPGFTALSREQKIAEIKKEFANQAWCEFRDCVIM